MPDYELTFAVGDVTVTVHGADDEDDALDVAIDMAHDQLEHAFERATVYTREVEVSDAA